MFVLMGSKGTIQIGDLLKAPETFKCLGNDSQEFFDERNYVTESALNPGETYTTSYSESARHFSSNGKAHKVHC